MKTLEFKIFINAPREKVWQILWENESYREWASVFCDGTYAVSDWKEGDVVHFLSPGGMGINSIILKRVDDEYMAFKHLSEIKEYKVLSTDESQEGWSGAMETYRLISTENGTLLEATMDMVEKYTDYFEETYPKAFEKIKELSEKQ
jgi:reverse gyrase